LSCRLILAFGNVLLAIKVTPTLLVGCVENPWDV